MKEGRQRRSSSCSHRSTSSLPLLASALCIFVASLPVVLAGGRETQASSEHGVDRAEAAKSSSVAWTILAVGLALPALAQVAVLCLGQLPPLREVSEDQQSRFPDASILTFTLIVRVGMLANYTVILPFAASMSTSSGQGSANSGYLIAVTSAGSIAGLIFFGSLPVQKLRLAYISHGLVVFLGNSCWALAGQIRSFALLGIARLFVGLEAGVGCNTSLCLAHHARGDAMTTCFFMLQFAQDMGVLLGPVLAAFSTWVVKASGSTSTQLQEEAGTIFMACWGFLLVAALLIYGPLPDPPDIEYEGCRSDIQVPLEDLPNEGASIPDIDEHSKPKEKGNALGLLLVLAVTGYLRNVQRILFESGVIYILQAHYQWSPEASGLVMLPTIAYCAVLEILMVVVLKGVFSDKTLVFGFEIQQLLACMLMLYGARTANSKPVWLIVGGMVLYGANGLCGAAITPLCLKRAIPDSIIANRQALVVGGCFSVFAGCFFGALASRVVLGEAPSPSSLVLLMLGTCLVQLLVSYLSLEATESRRDKA